MPEACGPWEYTTAPSPQPGDAQPRFMRRRSPAGAWEVLLSHDILALHAQQVADVLGCQVEGAGGGACVGEASTWQPPASLAQLCGRGCCSAPHVLLWAGVWVAELMVCTLFNPCCVTPS